MTNETRAYLLFYILVFSGLLFFVNSYFEVLIFPISKYIRVASTLLVIPAILGSLVYFVKRNSKSFKIALIITSLFLGLNLLNIGEAIALEVHKYEMAQIAKINTCEKATDQFSKDLKNERVKYFMFGMGVDEQFFTKLEDEFNLEVYHMGCMVVGSLECYNEQVEKHYPTLDQSENK